MRLLVSNSVLEPPEGYSSAEVIKLAQLIGLRTVSSQLLSLVSVAPPISDTAIGVYSTADREGGTSETAAFRPEDVCQEVMRALGVSTEADGGGVDGTHIRPNASLIFTENRAPDTLVSVHPSLKTPLRSYGLAKALRDVFREHGIEIEIKVVIGLSGLPSSNPIKSLLRSVSGPVCVIAHGALDEHRSAYSFGAVAALGLCRYLGIAPPPDSLLMYEPSHCSEGEGGSLVDSEPDQSLPPDMSLGGSQERGDDSMGAGEKRPRSLRGLSNGEIDQNSDAVDELRKPSEEPVDGTDSSYGCEADSDEAPGDAGDDRDTDGHLTDARGTDTDRRSPADRSGKVQARAYTPARAVPVRQMREGSYGVDQTQKTEPKGMASGQNDPFRLRQSKDVFAGIRSDRPKRRYPEWAREKARNHLVSLGVRVNENLVDQYLLFAARMVERTKGSLK